MNDENVVDKPNNPELVHVEAMTESTLFDKSQIRVTVYYDSCDQFMYDIGADREHALSS
jgi:hypothetical protein